MSEQALMLALASAWLGAGEAGRLVPAALAAHAAGFRAVFASVPPSDGAKAVPLLARLSITTAGVAARPPSDRYVLDEAIDRAAEGAASVKARAIVVEAGGLRAGQDRERALPLAVDEFARALHAACGRWPGLAIGIRNGAPPAPTVGFGFRETGWCLDALRGKPVGLWFDPARALLLERAKEEGTAAGPPPAAWAEAYGSRTAGMFLHGLGGGAGHARPEDDGPDWVTLREMTPARAARVLDVGPLVSRDELVDVRRHFEEFLGW